MSNPKITVIGKLADTAKYMGAEDVAMCRGLSEWLCQHWLTKGESIK